MIWARRSGTRRVWCGLRFRTQVGSLRVRRVERGMALRFKRIHVAGFLSAIAVAVGSGCGDPQLNQSRLEPLFVAQPVWSTAYAPGLVVVSQFPGLLSVENPIFVSTNPSVATVSVIPADSPFGFDGNPAVRLDTRAPGTSDIMLFDNESLVHAELIRVTRPRSWRFDFTVQNQVAPPDAALSPNEAVQILELGRVPSLVAFSASQPFSVSDSVVASGKIEFTNDLLLEVLAPSLATFGASAEELRFNQLSSGDLVSVAPGGSGADVGITLPSGEALFPPRFETTIAVRVEELEIVVSPRSEMNRADVAVYGVADSKRVLGLSPVATIDGFPLGRFGLQLGSGGGSRSFLLTPWLFTLPPGVRSGTLEVRWEQLVKSVELVGVAEGACTTDANTTVYAHLDYTDRDGNTRSGMDAATAVATDCPSPIPRFPMSRVCTEETVAVLSEPSPGSVEALSECVESCVGDVINAITGESLTPNCVECYARLASCQTAYCTGACALDRDDPQCFGCNIVTGCAQEFFACSGHTAVF